MGELAVRSDNLGFAGAAGTIPIGSRVVLAGLGKVPTLNGREGTVVGLGEAGSGRLNVMIDGKDAENAEAKALKAENLVLLFTEPDTESPQEVPGIGISVDKVSDREKLLNRKRAAALEVCPVGSRVCICGLTNERGHDNTGDVELNGQEGTVDKNDPDEPDRLIVSLPPIKKHGIPDEVRLKSISYKNLTRLDAAPKEEPLVAEVTSIQIHGSSKRELEAAQVSSSLQVLGAGGKRCKITEIAVAGGDKVAAFASAARNRNVPTADSASKNPGGSEAARSNALIYAKADAVSLDDDVANGGVTRLVQLCANFVMKAVCVVSLDIGMNGSGKIGSKSAATMEELATWLTGGESDGILRRHFKEGQACGGEPDGILACRRCAEKGLKGGRILGLLRKNVGGFKDFVGRGCKER